jgi:hypothetical protein
VICHSCDYCFENTRENTLKHMQRNSHTPKFIGFHQSQHLHRSAVWSNMVNCYPTSNGMIFITWTGSCKECSFYKPSSAHQMSYDVLTDTGFICDKTAMLTGNGRTNNIQYFCSQARMAYSQSFCLKIRSENFQIQKNQKTSSQLFVIKIFVVMSQHCLRNLEDSVTYFENNDTVLTSHSCLT